MDDEIIHQVDALVEDVDGSGAPNVAAGLKGGPISDDESRLLEELSVHGITYSGATEGHLVFSKRRDKRAGAPSRWVKHIPRGHVPSLLVQLSWNKFDHHTYEGYIVPDLGFAEITIQPSRGSSGLLLRKIRDLSLQTDSICPTVEEELAAPMPAVPFADREAITPRLHLPDSTAECCIEISNASAIAALLYCREHMRQDGFVATVKFMFSQSVKHSALVSEVDSLLYSLLYELDVRNGIVLNAVRKELPRDQVVLLNRKAHRSRGARFPETEIEHEVAALFNFASSATGNWPLAFLSYYQTLEYFIPAAVRQSALRDIRKELRDPLFDSRKDESLLRLISAAEGSANSPESQQFKILLRESVRRDRIIEFIESKAWGNHFTKNGPISAVEPLNPKNSQKDLMDQIAERIYKIRNRIVHAKDDPRYGDARVLLPQSDEAENLEPDVQLIRLVATEVILSGQVK